jgi:ribosomal protein L25 (general stress protein Ctc)
MSEKTVAAKLGIKGGDSVLVVGAPKGYSGSIGELPPKAKVVTKPSGKIDMIQLFVHSMDELKAKLSSLKASLDQDPAFWITYPKGTSNVSTDLNRDVIRNYAATVGYQAVSLFSVDETWSALRVKRMK